MRFGVFKILILLAFCLSLSAPGSPRHISDQKADSIHYLVELAEQNQKVLKAIDLEIRDVLMKSHNTNLTPKQGKDQLQTHSVQLEKLSLKRREYFLRQNFIDRLKFKIDKDYQGGEMKDFLSKTILELAHEEALDAQGDFGLTRFCNFLSLAIKQIPERNENLLGFVEGYMKFSSILNPVSPTEYIHHRSYTNGRDSYNAKPVAKEDVGEVVEERLEQLKARNLLNRKSFEQRRPILKPVAATASDAPAVKEPSTEAQLLPDVDVSGDGEDSLKLRIRLKDVHNPEEKSETPEPETARPETPDSESGYE